MPRIQRRAKIRTGFSDEDIDMLLTGFDFFSNFNGDETAMRSAWESLRDELLADWIAEHPGSRPWAWWRFECNEPRLRIDGPPHPFDNHERTEHAERVGLPPETYLRTNFGKPSCYFPPQVCDDFDARYESERDYLSRYGLLESGE